MLDTGSKALARQTEKTARREAEKVQELALRAKKIPTG
jgi:hypothetical protein